MKSLRNFRGWKLEKAEYKISSSRFDFLLHHKQNKRKLLLEVKSVTMVENGMGRFPDAVTARGARHIKELTELQGNEFQTAVLFVAQREDVSGITSAPEIDLHFAKTMEEAAHKGVQFFGRSCLVTPTGIRLNGRIPVYTEMKNEKG